MFRFICVLHWAGRQEPAVKKGVRNSARPFSDKAVHHQGNNVAVQSIFASGVRYILIMRPQDELKLSLDFYLPDLKFNFQSRPLSNPASMIYHDWIVT